jgi:outer membrane protein insertion porin family
MSFSGKHLLVLLVLFVLVAGVLQAEEWYISKPIVDIRFKGLQTISEIELRALLKSYISKDFTEAISWEIQGKLYALEYFDLLIPSALPGDPAKNSVILEIQVKEKPSIERVIFNGNNKIRGGELRDKIMLKKGSMASKTALKMDEQTIRDFYVEKGYIGAEVTGRMDINEETNSAVVTFDITEGYQTKVKTIRFSGLNFGTEKSLLGIMKTKAQSMFNKGNFVETVLQEDILLIEQFYKDNGYIDARVSDVARDLTTVPETGITELTITISMEEGDQYTYGGISFSGNKIYTQDDLKKLVYQTEGKVFSLSKFQSDYQRVADLYYENGYIYNEISYKLNRDEEKKEISIQVSIVETERAHIENIIIQGNDKTKTNVILRELPFEPGDVFSKKKVMSGIMNLYNTQYFAAIDPKPMPGSSPGLMDMIITVEEGRTMNIQFQVTFAGGPDLPIAGKIVLEDKNFLGRGYTVSAEVMGAASQQTVSLKFWDPWLLGLRWGGGVDLSYTHTAEKGIYQDVDGNGIPDPYMTQDEYDNADNIVPSDFLMVYDSHYISLGLNTGYVFPLPVGKFKTHTGIRTGFEYITYDPDVYQPFNNDIRDNLNSWLYSDSWWVRLAWDTRDIVYAPTKGFILSEMITIAGILPESNNHYMKSVTRFDVFFKLLDLPIDENFHFKMILKVHSAFSYLMQKPFSDIPLDPQKDGFYSDGVFTARGWSANTGNQAMWDNTIELMMPFASNILAFDLFFDGVGSWKNVEQLNNSSIVDYRFSFGGGLRIDNFQFPIAFYLAKKFAWEEVDGEYRLNWNPSPETVEFKDIGLDFVLSFNLDTYGIF